MSQLNHEGKVLPQEDLLGDAHDLSNVGQPISEVEIDELLHEEDRPVEERLSRLRELRSTLQAMEVADFSGDDDPQSLLVEIDRAIDRLERLGADPGEGLPASHDPTDHRELLSPDDDALAALDEQEEEAFEEEDVLDPSEWDEGDDFRPERGVH
jgi:hypothetical protein